MSWAVPAFSRNQVDKAGFILVNDLASADEREWAYGVINNWRSSHSYPLNNFQINLRRQVKGVKDDVIVAQRIKRLESIKAKLVRNQTNTLQLSQMQDIGGCRAVLSDIEKMKLLLEAYNRSKSSHIQKSSKDYVQFPKADGYRGHHLVYQYQAGPKHIQNYNKLRIEIQIRTVNQHAWATAVEAVGTFTRQALKSNQGSEDWLRFFALMGSAIAELEGCPLVPDTPLSHTELVANLRELSRKLYIPATLAAYSATVNYVGKMDQKSTRYFLMRLNPVSKKLSIVRFRAEESQQANLAYMDAEKQIKNDSEEQAVLVSTDSIQALKRAYPNYFLDTRRFSNILRDLTAA